jgi:diguanylate cyclase (GGDEF)-like protein
LNFFQMDDQVIRVLLVEDDEDDYIITRDLLLGVRRERFHLTWVASYAAALQTIKLNQYDICLFDYRLGEGDGLELLGKALAEGCKAPIILLTGLDDGETDIQAMKAGAADYLVKGQFDSKQLGRSICYAIERWRAKEELVERAAESEIQRAREELKDAETLAQTDALTGLGNRRKGEQAIQEAIAAAHPFSLLVFDLNGFKAINDLHGHNQGDQLLKAVAQRIRGMVRDRDVVCRWGGDEFVVVMQKSSLSGAEARAAQIQQEAFGEFTLRQGSKRLRVTVGAGVGIAEYQPGETAAALFERADQLLLVEKRRHPSERTFHSPSADDRSDPKLKTPLAPV